MFLVMMIEVMMGVPNQTGQDKTGQAKSPDVRSITGDF
jgi:hypothetical protein